MNLKHLIYQSKAIKGTIAVAVVKYDVTVCIKCGQVLISLVIISLILERPL